MDKTIKEIAESFNIDGKVTNIEVQNSGNINNTYIVTYEKNNKKSRILIQKINTTVFKEPYILMKNIDKVTNYILKKNMLSHNTRQIPLQVIKTKDNKILKVVSDQGEKDYYRAYNFIEGAVAYDFSVNEEVVYNTGKAFGNFQRILDNYPIDELEETIPDFHNTKKRFKNFIRDVKNDPNDRVNQVAKEIIFLLKREEDLSVITNLLEKGKIKPRVSHNDTKVNNVMMNEKTKEYMTVIDLDTVMPGSSLFDYGDGVRSAASNAKEDETDLSKVTLNDLYFEQYTDGYLSEMAPILNEEEVYNLGNSIKILTLELGMRFLNDYINGDTYFKTNYDTHNLDRARNQFALASDIENKMDYINSYIFKSYDKNLEEANTMQLKLINKKKGD